MQLKTFEEEQSSKIKSVSVFDLGCEENTKFVNNKDELSVKVDKLSKLTLKRSFF